VGMEIQYMSWVSSEDGKNCMGFLWDLTALANGGAHTTTINSPFLYGAKTWMHTYVIMAVQIRASTSIKLGNFW